MLVKNSSQTTARHQQCDSYPSVLITPTAAANSIKPQFSAFFCSQQNRNLMRCFVNYMPIYVALTMIFVGRDLLTGDFIGLALRVVYQAFCLYNVVCVNSYRKSVVSENSAVVVVEVGGQF
jgi:hypothetical protein